ncbi:MAG: excinuclease ABC subunit UvrC [Deltaproteobacteria bacterium]|nr:excinuclease ABC subunit UvrC [Deltaproteobacteria bacterium]
MTDDQDTLSDTIQDLLRQVPRRPGVYLMKNAGNRVLYVGKAANLRKRLPAYFRKSGPSDPKTRALVDNIASFETVVTATEKEALILEANLIRRYKPRYNVVLKDDKRYPLLRLNLQHPYPNLQIVRRINRDGAKYFGPYASAGAVRQTLKIVNRTFMLRKCKDKEFNIRHRPCLHFQMQACMAPCCMQVSKIRYKNLVDEVVLFLNGRTPDLVRRLKEDMACAARERRFEEAAVLRDKIFALEKTLEKQAIVSTDLKDRDVIAVCEGEGTFVIMLLFVRGGVILGGRHFEFEETVSTEPEVLETFIGQYYQRAHYIPPEVLISCPLEKDNSVAAMLGGLRGGKVTVHCPLRGEKRRLMQLAGENAAAKLADFLNAAVAEQDILARLQQRLGLRHFPDRIECFDNSSIYGDAPVSGMVVFNKGQPSKRNYRSFKIKTPKRNDDYAYMAEVLTRRFTGSTSRDPFPDLLMVDGGKGQLNIAVDVLGGLGLAGAFDVIGIAKMDRDRGETVDKIYKPGRMNPVVFRQDRDALLFLQKIRDEAHRFAIGFHRRRRGRDFMASVLDDIEGVGRQRKRLLLRRFGSVQGIREASLEEIAGVPGVPGKVARNVKERLSK